jgi:hypothetical protein
MKSWTVSAIGRNCIPVNGLVQVKYQDAKPDFWDFPRSPCGIIACCVAIILRDIAIIMYVIYDEETHPEGLKQTC